MTLSKKQKTWGIIIVILAVLAIIGKFTKNEEPRNYIVEANQLVEKLRNPTSEEQLVSDYQKAETLFKEMQQVSDNSDAFIIVQMELEALTSYKEQNIENETKKLKIKKLFHPWDGSNISLERHIKSKMNDPKSYEHVKTTYQIKDEKLIIYTEFRGKNSFNAMVLNNAVAVEDFDGNILEVKIGN